MEGGSILPVARVTRCAFVPAAPDPSRNACSKAFACWFLAY